LQPVTCSAVSTAILLVNSAEKSSALVARETHASVPEVPFQSNLKSPKSPQLVTLRRRARHRSREGKESFRMVLGTRLYVR